MRLRLRLPLFILCALFLAGASLAMAEEVTRDTYKAAVEPICKTNTEANEKILKGVRQEVKAGKLKAAGTQFAKAASALNNAYAQLKAVPQPPADAAKLAKWLAYVKTEAKLFGEAAAALKANNKTRAQTIVVKLTHNANLANNQVISFGFRYCKLEPSKFT
jgi:hypothetical protein